ncbi:Zn-dependent hydrolase [Gorillibacterium massiliense]|uniref:Zn-dependent hydrolase n=1 Tax=Gorillibacterium massiliense TaxID=1280390 RepID=UPI0004BC123C|nr:Zn-dependent hydrolase [Gorillibacterium massiliense]
MINYINNMPYKENRTELRKWISSQIEDWLDGIAQFGCGPEGGVTRFLYDNSWQDAHKSLADRMRQYGLEVYADRVGNLFGTSPSGYSASATEVASAASPIAPIHPILVGSHLDTVQCGGRYDGAYGIVAAVIAISYLRSAFGPPVRTLEAVALCEEEGSRFPLTFWGSGSITGLYHPEQAAGFADGNGVTLEQAMDDAGFGRSDQPEADRSGRLYAFLEVHIEQGRLLETSGDQLGIVTTIAGQRRFTVTVDGRAEHAGTTPMVLRRDALAGAAEMINLIEKMAVSRGAPLVATVGSLQTHPGTVNVIPGCATFSLDVRHADADALDVFCQSMEAELMRIASSRRLTLDVRPWMSSPPVQLDPILTDAWETAARSCGYTTRRMVSGAGHDAQIFQAIVPSALLFVPSRQGISHAPGEYTEPEQLADGIIALIEFLYKLAYGEKTHETI